MNPPAAANGIEYFGLSIYPNADELSMKPSKKIAASVTLIDSTPKTSAA